MLKRSLASHQRVMRAAALGATLLVSLVALELVDVLPASAATTVIGVSPDAGSTSGGTFVTIAGTNFSTGTTTVSFGTTVVTGTQVSPTSVTATSPLGSGTVNVQVTDSNGTSPISGADQFTYGAPTVTLVAPDAGSTSGSTSVTITGTNFASGATVSFGTSAATGVTVVSTTSITATSPSGTGTRNVTVTTADGTSATSGADLFSYGAPTVTAVSPDAGLTSGGTGVTITGTNFASGAAVSFGATGGAAATGVTVVSATSITATSPSGTGTRNVTVTTSNGTSATSGADLFSYGAPTVTAVSPDAGLTSGGTSVTITGTNFASGATVSFGASAATGVVVNSSTAIIATSPSGTGTVAVTVTTPAGTSATSGADLFGYGNWPSAPIDVQAVAMSSVRLMDSAAVSWSPPSVDGGSPVTSYTVLPFDVTTSTAGKEVVVTTTAVTIGGLVAGDMYTFSVVSTTLIGTGAPASSNAVVPVGVALDSYKQATSRSPRSVATVAIGRRGARGSIRAEGTGKGTVVVGQYPSKPIAAIEPGGSYYDLSALPGSAFSRVSLTLCGLPRGYKVQWWDAQDRSVRRASAQTKASGRGSCTTMTVTRTSTPNLGQLVGTLFIVPGRYFGRAPLLLASANGAVHGLGRARVYGSLPASDLRPVSPVVAIAVLRDRSGYWLATRAGGVFAFGKASFYGSLPTSLVAPVVAIAATPDGKGYWLVDANGGIYPFGDASFSGSLVTSPPAPIVAIAATPDGKGYWLVDANGGIYPFGDASFYGSLQSSALRPAAPIVAIAASPDGKGYWLVDANGGVSRFGDAAFYGSVPAKKRLRISGIVITANGGGYWLVAKNGEALAFGDARRYGPIATGRAIPRASIVGAA